MSFIPLDHLRVQHNYTGSTWQDFTGDLVSAQVNLREFSGTHTAALSFYRANMDPSQGSGTRVIKKGDKVRISARNGSGKRRKMGRFFVRRVTVEIDLKQPVGRQNKVTVALLGLGVAGVAGTGGSSGVAAREELSNVITGAPFQIDADANTHAWTGTTGASTSTLVTPEGDARTNLCTNGSVEHGTTGWSTNAATATQDDAWSDDGGYSLKVAATGSSTDSYASISAALTTGHTYTISATARLVGVLGGSTSAHARRISVFDATLAHNYESTQVTNDEGETRVSVTFTAAITNTHLIRVYNGHNTAGATVWWDAVLIEESSTDLGYFDGDSLGYLGAGITAPTDGVLLRTNLCTNPSFETNTTGWTAIGAGLAIAQSATRAISGADSLRATWPTGAANATQVSYANSSLVVGTTYTFSAYVYVPTGSPDVRLQTGFLTLGASTSVKDAWTRISVTFVATAASNSVQMTNAAASTSGQTAYLDGCLIEKGTVAGTYFSGADTDTSAWTYAWTGTANASTSTATGAYTEAISIDTASEHDQILLTRDSNPGTIAFEDPDGTIQIYSQTTRRTGSPTVTIDADSYSAIDMAFDMSHIVNVLQLFYFEKVKVGNKKTRKVEHDVTFTDPTSIAKYGRFKKKHQIHKKADFSDYADSVFARNADPEEVPRSVTIPIIAAGDLLGGYEDGHYVGGKVKIVLPDGVTTYTCRVARIEHNISPTKWTVQVFVRDQNLMQKVRHHNALSTEVAHNPDGLVLTAHLDDASVDGTKLEATAVDGKTVTGATIQTDSSGNRIVMRDDSSEGIIEFWTGVAGETKGQINPQVDVSGNHFIDFRTTHTASGDHVTPGRMQLMGSTAIEVPTLNLPNSTKILGNDAIFSDVSAASLSTTGLIDAGGNIDAGGHVSTGNPPSTASAANTRIGTGGVLNIVTSLRKAKIDIEPLSDAAVRGVLSLEPVSFYDLAEVEANGGSTEGLRRIPGLIAEDVERHVPALATYDEAGALQGVAYDRLAALLVPLLAEALDRIAVLEARIQS